MDLKGSKTIKGCKDKIAQIDQQLQELQKAVYQPKSNMKIDSTKHGKKKKKHNRVPIQTDVTTSLVEQMQI